MSGKAMGRLVAALLSGTLFGFGLALSGMIDPARVTGFLNLAAPRWDPSLLFVLGGAVGVARLGVVLCGRRPAPLLDDQFDLPQSTRIDKPLVLGAALFGVGWGLAGLCPGPALAAVSFGNPGVLLFVAAMAIGMIAHDRLRARAAPQPCALQSGALGTGRPRRLRPPRHGGKACGRSFWCSCGWA